MLRRMRLQFWTDLYTTFIDRRAVLPDMPMGSRALEISSILPMDFNLAQVLASGAVQAYDLDLLLKVLRDHRGFQISANVETFNDVRDRQTLIMFDLRFETVNRQAAESMLAATKPTEPPVTPSRRVSLRRGISGS